MVSKVELQQIRIQTATEMCIQNPHLLKMLFSKKQTESPKSQEEKIRYRILKELTKLEPCIEHILEYYSKRNS